MRWLPLILCYALAWISSVSAFPSPGALTNAARFAQGLPPLAPRMLYSASRAKSAHRARQSAVPPAPFTCPVDSGYAVCCSTSGLVPGTPTGTFADSSCSGAFEVQTGDCSDMPTSSSLCCLTEGGSAAAGAITADGCTFSS